MAEKTWPEVKAVLDDPSVAPGMKTMLLQAWQQQHPAPGWAEKLGWPPEFQDQMDAHQAEVDKYAKAYNAENDFLFGDINLDDAYDAAKKSGDQAGYNEREEKKAVDEGKTTLDGKQPPGSGGTGTQTSDELFDAAAPALKLFETFGSLLAKIPPDCRGNTRPLDFQKDIQARFDEQRGISFKNFMDDADHFKTGSTTSEQTSTDTGTALKTLFQSWSGQGADSASEHYNQEIQPKVEKLVQTLDDANEATTTAVSTIFQLCKGKADAVVKNYTDTVGKADFNMAQRVVNVANGEHAEVDDLKPIAGWMDLNFGTNLVSTLNDDGCCDDDDIKNHGIDLAKQWIQNAFNPDMWDRLYKGFDKTCKDTLDLVNQAYDALDEVMGKIKNEFEGSTEPAGSTQPSQSGGPGTGGGPGGSGPGDSGAGGPGAGGGPGTGSGSGGASTPSATQPGGTEDPQEVADAAKKEAEQGTNPYTGKPMEVNPETGEPYPIDPKTGEAIKDGGDEPETLKVQQGDKTIEMAEPDKDGKMDIKVGEGQGDPKDYKLDWGDGKDDAAGQAGAAGQDPAQQGAGDGKPGPDGTYQPGPDGKIHIQDGDLKITAERPDGPDGPTVVTVDDGSGTPTTYTLGDDKNPADAAGKEGATASEGAASQQDAAGRAGSGLDGSAGQAGSGVDGGAAGQAGSGLDDSAGPAGSGAGGAVGGEGVGGGVAGGEGGSAVGEVSTMPTGAGGLTPDGVAADGGAAGGSGDSSGAGATVPASGGTGGGGLDPVGAGIGGGGGGAPEGAVSGTLGATDSLSPGTSTGAAVLQGQPSLGMQPVGSADAAAAMQQQQGSGAGGLGSMGGMPMMGGGGAGGEGGGDQERSSRGYRIDGGIFNSGGAGGRITGSLDDEGDRSVTDRPAPQR